MPSNAVLHVTVQPHLSGLDSVVSAFRDLGQACERMAEALSGLADGQPDAAHWTPPDTD